MDDQSPGFVEFPKWLFKGNVDRPDTLLVSDAAAQEKAKKKGWKTADEFHVEQPKEE